MIQRVRAFGYTQQLTHKEWTAILAWPGYRVYPPSTSDVPLPIEEAVTFVLQACEAVAEAHAAGIVHRDLKPANLFLAKRADGTRLVKVLDFGISKSVAGASAADLSLTNTSAMIGSPLYMSPEQMHSAKNVDVRTDIWALGAILYQCLTNRPPYVADSIPALCSALLNDMPPPLASFRDDVPEALALVVAKALEKDRVRRWPGVGELARALTPFAPEARVHAERAARMLASTDVQVSAAPSTEVSPGMGASSGISSSSSAAVSAERVEMEEQATVADHKDRTLDSWGKTGDAARASTPPRTKRRSLAVIAAGVVVAAVVVAVGVSRTTATATPTPLGVAPRSEPAAAALVPEAVPQPVAEAVKTAEPAAEPSATVQVAPAKLAPLKSEKLPSSKHAAPAKSAKPSGLPDFGGRR